MRATAILILAATAAAALLSPAAARMGFEDNKLNFKSCDGRNLTARWRDNNFHLSVPGKTLDPSAPELKVLGWNGSCQSISVDDNGRFKGAGGNDAASTINYVSWDDSKWAATRAGTGFFVVFVAGKDEAASAEKLKEAALWLKRHDGSSRAASLLAQELDAESGK